MWLRSSLLSVLLITPVLHAAESKPRLPVSTPEKQGMSSAKLMEIEKIVKAGIAQKRLPGAVVLVLRRGHIVYRKAIGHRSLLPVKERMTIDTLFDLASLTKPLATATAIMQLIEARKLRLSDRVSRHLPDFAQNGKANITIEQLLTHTSGLIADNSIRDYQNGQKLAWKRIFALKPIATPGTRFIYSDVGYLVLGAIVEKITKTPLDVYTLKHIYDPLKLEWTRFKPTLGMRRDAAPTEKVDGKWLKGMVHDPRARALGNVGGHAGLFSRADDLAVLAQMFLNGGSFQKVRILHPETVRTMTTPRPVPRGYRALGWDVQTRFSSNRGEGFELGSFGHTGFTGPSIWIDPRSETAVIFLTNRVHPNGKGSVVRLRGAVSTVVAESIVSPPFPQRRPHQRRKVLTGIDVLKSDNFRSIQNQRIALLTNHTGVDRQGNRTIDLLFQAKNLKLLALLTSEDVESRDRKTGLPVIHPKSEKFHKLLPNLDSVILDLQTVDGHDPKLCALLTQMLRLVRDHKKKLLILDRPNPTGGDVCEGSVDQKWGLSRRHGLTLGELALFLNREQRILAEVAVIRMKEWSRHLSFDETGLLWIDPRKDIPSVSAAYLEPGIGLLSKTNVSIGQGSECVYSLVGAPWIDGVKLADELTSQRQRSYRIVPVRFRPEKGEHANKECGGIRIHICDWSRFSSIELSRALALALQKLYPVRWKGHGSLLKNVKSDFRKVRARYLLYR